ncbi:receptor-like kinase TMK4 [Phoenix dactylifera]|uniref:Receptor-like kinase TMK4 n=1 Tax=Phoenix dactylifera TaxID=42345 RepID=A0A8B7BF43_PHODC|nr:receptor-like kinase TMK4 [Phoenix dactylifera]
MKKKKCSSPLLLLPLLLLFFFSLFPSPTLSAASDGDRVAMVDIAEKLTNLPSSWTTDSDPCQWAGVNCRSGRIATINLALKGVAGTLSSSISKLSSLTNLQLQQNQISGPLPSLAKLSELEIITLDGNAFSSIPNDFFSGLSALQSVSLDDNPLAPWVIPADLADSINLVRFSASNTSINGEIPEFFGTLGSLQSLRISYNNMTGGLPDLFRGSSIQNLWLNNQQSPTKFSGSIDVIGSMTQLSLVWLQSNSFTGPIPDLSKLSSLASFNVRDNSLTGLVPPSLTSCPTLKNVSLSNNQLQGPYPKFAARVDADIDKGNNFCNSAPGSCNAKVTMLLAVAEGFEYPLNLANSWMGNDPCGGNWFGVNCDNQNNIIVLNFANQHFEGIISPDIANFTSLTKLILSNNNLSGPIPDSLKGLPNLQLLDVTNNNLSGIVPDFPNHVTLKLKGNHLLGSSSGSGGGSSSSSSPSDGPSESPSAGDQPTGSKSSGALIAGILVAVLILIACFLAFFYSLYRKKHAQRFGRVPTGSPPNEPESIKTGVMGTEMGVLNSQSGTGSANTYMVDPQGMHMSIRSLRRATNNFNEENILGRGGFGVVYKGELNGTLIAVKRSRVDLTGTKGNDEFKAEIDVLSKVRHRHLVALLGYYDDGNERLLVYEYMPGGTLEQHLFDYNKIRCSPLTWKQRLTIALDMARGVEYLHSLAQESFIHRDLKPSNILLDNDMRAKVSDFGLVKHCIDKQKSMMTRLAGTFGYLAPEYASTGRVTTKVDVYAFGVILMELITGQKVLDDRRPDDDSSLVPIFHRNILNKDEFLKSCPDPNLELDEKACRSLMEVAELARYCTAREPSHRPDMSYAVNKLAPLVVTWKPTAGNEGRGDVSSLF